MCAQARRARSPRKLNTDPGPHDTALAHVRGSPFVHELKRRAAPAESLEKMNIASIQQAGVEGLLART
jgi:hypothetical protein